MRLLIFLTSFLMIQIVRHAVGTPSFEKEPSCSPFHFEEKLLEKTVRLEHSVGLMMDEIKSFVAITETKMVESETKMAASEAKMAALQLQNEDLK